MEGALHECLMGTIEGFVRFLCVSSPGKVGGRGEGYINLSFQLFFLIESMVAQI